MAWHAAHCISPPKTTRAAPPAVLAACPRDSLPHQSGIQRSLVAHPLWATGPWSPAASLATSDRLQCTSPGHHAAPGSLLQRPQRCWRSFWRHSRNKRPWHGPRTPPGPHWPLLVGQSTSCPSHFASAATHNTSRQHCTRPDRVPGDPSLSLITALCLT
ncbi:hypothetical protein BDW02DRAFT_181065 [Decorospora gaudefroyi]|uniref:Uncharacterized protein n=1 Tax=Decorospora gaudefroyi TaxID=184978 RepID=A0A6A5KFS7_9PLEO|nr:hypothetical protein BDW02DRAFT_181065 [Decorospora gaudefroyi]